jgi:hypothetical protein
MVQLCIMDTSIWKNEPNGMNDCDSNTSLDEANKVDDDNSWDVVSKVTRDEDSILRIMGQETQTPHDAPTLSLIEWHIRPGHMSIKRIQALAKFGKIPKVLSTCNIPLCTGCFYGRLTRQPC